jgi:hypothetical protein
MSALCRTLNYTGTKGEVFFSQDISVMESRRLGQAFQNTAVECQDADPGNGYSIGAVALRD